MNPETLIQVQNIIEKFGFPVFVALCGLALFATDRVITPNPPSQNRRL